VVSQEAASLAMSTTQVNSFLAKMEIAGKGGNDTVGSVNNWSWYTYVKLPCWQNGGMTQREYAAGAWVNNSTSRSNAQNAVNVGSSEILRNEIRACLLTLKNHVFGSFSNFGTSCGGRFTPLTHSASGNPEIGQRVAYKLNGTRSGVRTTSIKIGVSKTYWNRVPLPLHLAFLGAPGCYWRTGTVAELLLAAVNGKANVLTTIPLDRSLIGLNVFTQFLTAEPGANAAGLTATNGVQTTIGGQK
jgi:hypothetical protein